MKLLKLSTELIPEQVSVSIRAIQDSNTMTITLSAISIDCSLSDYIRLNLLINTQIALTGAIKDGQIITLGIYQADSVIHTITYDSNIKVGTDISSFPILSQTLGKLDRLVFMYDLLTNSYFLIDYKRGY